MRQVHTAVQPPGTPAPLSRAMKVPSLILRTCAFARMLPLPLAAVPAMLSCPFAQASATLLRIPHLKWGALDVCQLGIAPLPADSAKPLRAGDVIGMIGGDLLRHARFEIDYPDSVAYFDRTSYTDEDRLLTIGLTLQPTSSGQYFVMGVASKDGAPTVAGVERA